MVNRIYWAASVEADKTELMQTVESSLGLAQVWSDENIRLLWIQIRNPSATIITSVFFKQIIGGSHNVTPIAQKKTTTINYKHLRHFRYLNYLVNIFYFCLVPFLYVYAGAIRFAI